MGLRRMGMICKNYRKGLHVTQQQVADETGYTRNHISTFESGKVSNILILMWYIEHGLNPDLVRKEIYYRDD